MSDVVGRGVIELVGDARKLQASISEAKKSIRTLGEGQRDISKSAAQSIDNYIGKLQQQNATFGKTVRETELYKLALRGASNEQIKSANGALKIAEANARGTQSFRAMGIAQLGLGIGFIAASTQLVRMSDEYTKFTAQLRLASSSQSEYARGLEAVRQISTASQTSISAVGTLYARIANSTKELGIGQKGVADITESVSLALKASGATAGEASSAMLQLSQAFGSGKLRGEEFNAVNEAAPRLMRALADGLGVPVGQLRELATQGKITSEVMARVLPAALGELRKEAAEVQTISGAFTVLTNKVVEFVGVQAKSSSAASAISKSFLVLADNLNLVVAAVAGLAVLKLSQIFISLSTAISGKTAAVVQSVAALQAERAATIASAAADATKTASVSAAAAAEVARFKLTLDSVVAERARAVAQLSAAQATIAATAAMGAQSAALAANTAAHAANAAAIANLASLGRLQALATAQMAAAQTAHAAAVTASTVSQAAHATALGASGVAAGLLSRTVAALGGPIGLVTTALSLGATAWVLWGSRADEAARKAASSTESSTREIVANLDVQITKLRERLALITVVGGGEISDAARAGAPGSERLAAKLAEINALKAKGAALTNVERVMIINLEGQYQDLAARVKTVGVLQADISRAGQQKSAGKWLEDYATNAEKLAAELAKAKKELGEAFTPEIERRIRERFAPKTRADRKAPVDNTDAQEAKAQLAFDLEQIRKASEATISAFSNQEKVMQALRSAGLADEKKYFDEKAVLIRANANEQESAFQKEIARLQQETFVGKNAAKERLDNDRKIADVQAKIAKVRADASADIRVNSIQEFAAAEKLADANTKLARSYEDAKVAADDYIASVIRRNKEELAGVGRGNQFREIQSGRNQIEDKFIAQSASLNRDLRNQLINPDQFAQYLKLAQDTFSREVIAYDDRTEALLQSQKSWINGANEALQNYIDESANVARQTEDLFSNAFKGAEDALVEFTKTGKLNFKGLIDSIVANINRMTIKESITGPLAKFLKDGEGIGGVGEGFGKITELLGFGKKQAAAPVEERSLTAALTPATAVADATAFSTSVAAAATGFTTGVTAAGTALGTAVTTSGTVFGTGIGASSATLSASIAAAGATFAAEVTAAGAAFAATVATSSAASAAGSAAGVLGSFATGINFVPKTGLYQLHKGESVTPEGKSWGGTSVNIYQSFAPGADTRTVNQAAAKAGQSVQRAMARNT